MKIRILFICLLFAGSGFGQVDSDTVILKKEPFVSRLLYNDPLQKHHHIIDLETFDFYPVTLGYNYLYSILPSLRVGGRLGVNLSHLNKNKYPTSILGLQLECLISYRVWKSIYIEGSVSLVQSYGISVILGNGDSSLVHPGSFYEKASEISPMYEIGANVTLFKHYFLRSGINWQYDRIPDNYYESIYLSLGYKF